jgi:hypothetical protein
MKIVFYIPKERVYWLDKNSKDLIGGATFVSAIRPEPVELQAGAVQGTVQVSGGASILPAQPRVQGREDIVVGLNTVVEEPTKKHYFVVDSMGVALQQGRYAYAASSPSAAAVKAFYAWWRTSKQGDKCVARNTVALKISAVPPALVQYLADLKADVTQEQKKEYVKQFLCIDTEKISRELIIRIGTAGKGGSVRFYRVSYKPNLRPNPLEIRNRMVVMASALWITQEDKLPPNAVEFETVV